MSNAPASARTIVQIPAGLKAKNPHNLRWGTVSTIRAPLRDIARFVAFHLDLGAAQVHIYLDVPDRETAAFFAGHPAVTITQCTDEYWAIKREKARSTHQLRQAFNATQCYRKSDLDWLAHIDVDEFILAPVAIAQLLADTPDDAAFARLRPAELLAQPDPWSGPSHFKLTRQEAGVARAVIRDFYPEFGAYVPEGMISYVGGKNIARTGLPGIRFGLHSLSHKGARVSNGHLVTSAHIGHAHAPSWEVFHQHLAYRMTKGSYRRKPNESMKVSDVIEVVYAEEGDRGVRRFFDELCQASPRLLANLAAHDLLLTATLDLDEKTRRWFGDVPGNEADR